MWRLSNQHKQPELAFDSNQSSKINFYGNSKQQ